MRLGQLARKIGVRPGEMIEFLAEHNIQIEEGSNTKLEDTHLSLLLDRFDPDSKKNKDFEESPQPETVVTANEGLDESGTFLEKSEPEDSNKPISAEEEKGEVIKAPKVVLSGLKVLGKIELPEPKKKQPEVSPDSEGVSESPKVFNEVRRASNFKKPATNQRPSKNPIALKREREELETKEKHELEARLEKEKRTQNYLKKVKSFQPSKAARLINEPTMEMSAAELAEQPKTWWGKFIKWVSR